MVTFEKLFETGTIVRLTGTVIEIENGVGCDAVVPSAESVATIVRFVREQAAVGVP